MGREEQHQSLIKRLFDAAMASDTGEIKAMCHQLGEEIGKQIGPPIVCSNRLAENGPSLSRLPPSESLRSFFNGQALSDLFVSMVYRKDIVAAEALYLLAQAADKAGMTDRTGLGMCDRILQGAGRILPVGGSQLSDPCTPSTAAELTRNRGMIRFVDGMLALRAGLSDNGRDIGRERNGAIPPQLRGCFAPPKNRGPER